MLSLILGILLIWSLLAVVSSYVLGTFIHAGAGRGAGAAGHHGFVFGTFERSRRGMARATVAGTPAPR